MYYSKLSEKKEKNSFKRIIHKQDNKLSRTQFDINRLTSMPII